MHWTDRRAARANLAHELMSRNAGWKLYNYKPDLSDSMTDYYDPASWVPGVATKGEAVIVVDAHASDVERLSGKPIIEHERIPTRPCERCGGTGIDPSGWTLEQARQDPRRYHRETNPPGTIALLADVVSPIPFRETGELRCRGAGCTDGQIMKIEERVVDIHPEFEAPPGRSNWCVIVGGVIVGRGQGLGPCARRDEEGQAATRRLVDKWLRLAEEGSAAPDSPLSADASGRPQMRLNERLHGVEIQFPTKPSEPVRERLRASGFRWHRQKRIWYARQTKERVALATELTT